MVRGAWTGWAHHADEEIIYICMACWGEDENTVALSMPTLRPDHVLVQAQCMKHSRDIVELQRRQREGVRAR